MSKPAGGNEILMIVASLSCSKKKICLLERGNLLVAETQYDKIFQYFYKIQVRSLIHMN